MPVAVFNIRKIAEESGQILIHPGQYFQGAVNDSSYSESIIKTLFYGLCSGIITLIGSVSGITGGGVLGELFRFQGLSLFIMSIVSTLAGLIILSAVLALLSVSCNGKKAPRTLSSIASSLLILSPLMAIISFTGYINLYLGNMLTLSLCLYGVFLLYSAAVHGLECDEMLTRIIATILAVVPVLLLLSIMLCSRADVNSTFRPVSEYDKEKNRAMEELMNSRFVKQNLEIPAQNDASPVQDRK